MRATRRRGSAERARLAHDIKRDQRCERITDPRYKADQGIKSKADVRSGNEERRIEQGRERVDPRDPLSTGPWRGNTEGGGVEG